MSRLSFSIQWQIILTTLIMCLMVPLAMAQPKNGMHKVWAPGQQSDRLIVKFKSNSQLKTSRQIDQYISRLGNKVGERFSHTRKARAHFVT